MIKATHKTRVIAESYPGGPKITNFILKHVNPDHLLLISAEEVVLACNVPKNGITLCDLDIPIHIVRQLQKRKQNTQPKYQGEKIRMSISHWENRAADRPWCQTSKIYQSLVLDHTQNTYLQTQYPGNGAANESAEPTRQEKKHNNHHSYHFQQKVNRPHNKL